MIHGLFFAIYPDAETARRIDDLAWDQHERQGLTGRPLGAERYHVTLYGLGEYASAPAALLEGAQEALADIRMPPFLVQFEHVLSFKNPAGRRAFVMVGGDGVIGLETLREHLETAVGRRLPKLRRRPRFYPHMTLLYDDRLVAEQRVEPIRWIVTEVVLVDRLKGRGRHIRLGGRRLGEAVADGAADGASRRDLT